MGNILFNKQLFGSSGSGTGGGSQVKSMPEATASRVGKIVQYVGESTSEYINGYFYKCEASTGETPTYSWVRTNVQPSGGGEGGAVDDVTINSQSIVTRGTAVIPNATASTIGVSKAVQVSTMPTASATYVNQVVQFIGDTTSDYEQGLFYICELQGSTYSWNYLPTDLIGSSSDFGLVKVDNSSIIANSGVISANKATGAYSTTFVGNPTTTVSSTNIGVNSTVHGRGSTAIGCDSVVGTPSAGESGKVPGAIQLGSGSNQEAGTFKVGLSTNGSDWGHYTLIDATGKIPTAMYTPATASAIGAVKPDGTTVTITADGTISAVGGSSSVAFANITGQPTDNANLSIALSNKQNLLAAGANISIVNNTISATTTDVQINGTSITSSGVANIPYAGSTNAGAIKTNTSYGTSTNSDGVLQAETKTYAEYNSIADTLFVGKGTLENVITGKALENTTGTFASGDTVTLVKNKTFTGTSITAVEVDYPASLDASFISEVDFTTGATVAGITLPGNTTYKGDDCSNGSFVPVASTTYSVIFAYNGSSQYAIVMKLS